MGRHCRRTTIILSENIDNANKDRYTSRRIYHDNNFALHEIFIVTGSTIFPFAKTLTMGFPAAKTEKEEYDLLLEEDNHMRQAQAKRDDL